MSATAVDQMQEFSHSVVRIVPDPIKDEAINVGVVVVGADGGGRMLTSLNPSVKARIQALQPDYDFASLAASLKDLEGALGIDQRIAFGQGPARPATGAVLEDAARTLGNQLQLTPPRRYVAQSLADAGDRLLLRYVTRRLPRAKKGKRLTHAVLRDQILQVVSAWKSPGLHIEPGGVLTGEKATHPADVVLRNGHPRAALFAIPTSQSDEDMPYLYRDRIPTIAGDMPSDFMIYAVLPAQDAAVSEQERRFAEETRRLLEGVPHTATVSVSDLDAVVRARVERLLVQA